jgi:hypothetical protein
MCSEFQVRYYLSTSSLLDLFQPASKQDVSRSCVLYKLFFKLIQQHFSWYCHVILGTASIYSYLLCFAQNEIASIAPLPPYRNGFLDGAWFDNHNNTCAASTPHVALHCSLIWVLHILLVKLATLSKRDNHQSIWVIQFDCQNWLHWKINQAQRAIFLQKRARIVVSIGKIIDHLYWLIAKKKLPWPIKQLSFDFLSCNWSNHQAIFAIEE